jgi:predicted RNA binding protein YcfA (HicA-like mRNA interferase family)
MAGDERLAEVVKMLEAKGYRLTRISGSHHIFTKAGARAIPIPVHRGKVKPAYVRMIRKLEA